MRIIIRSIQAEILNTSTMDNDDFLINHWIIQYEIVDSEHSIKGILKWTAVPIPYKIIKFITQFYDKRKNK